MPQQPIATSPYGLEYTATRRKSIYRYFPTKFVSSSVIYTETFPLLLTHVAGHQCESLSQWDLLSACQAVALYLLLWMRKRDHCSQFPCGNIALLFTLGRITKLLQSRYLHLSPSTNVLRPVNDWAAWIFCESCIRLASLYFVMNIVVSMDIGFSCDGPTDWRLQALPLPASKVVWDADTEAAWLSAIGGHANLNRRTLFGDLFDKKRVADHRAGVWEDSVDELGLIVGMAGSLFTTMS